MGCSQSKIDNEEAVTRCKERKHFIKQAVSARNAFSSAHSAYAITLKNTGAALSDYGHAAQVHQPSSSTDPSSVSLPPPPVDPLPPPPPPPPPPPNFPPPTSPPSPPIYPPPTPPLQRAASMPELVIPKPDPRPTETIQEEEEDDDDDDDDDLHSDETADTDLQHRSTSRRRAVVEEVAPPRLPSPPPSRPSNSVPPPPPQVEESTYDYLFPKVHDMPGPSLIQPEEIRQEKDNRNRKYESEEIRPEKDKRRYDGEQKQSENVASGSGTSSKVESQVPEKVIEPAMVKPVKKVKQMNTGVPAEAKKGGKVELTSTLLEILDKLDDKFLKAYESAYEVSKMLEANRLHYHSNFADNRGHIDHSAKLMRVITWNRSIRGLQNADDDVDDSDEHETLATVLDKLLAWEKKLYDEVKAGELMKLEYQRKVASLNKHSKRGTDSEAYAKAKAAVGHLHTRYIVDMQTMDSTVSEITNLRDDHLYPKLVSLVEGMAKMWETMSDQHRNQMKIVEDLKSLDVSQGPKETSEDHHKSTEQLCLVAEDWHRHFGKLVTHQKEYIQALSNWLKLNLIPIESNLKEKVSSPLRVHRPPIQGLLVTWHDLLEKLPDDLARGSIASFAAIMKHVWEHQEDEEKLKRKCEETRRELTRKTQSFEEWYHKYMQRKTPPDQNDPDRTEDANHNDPIAERQLAIEILKQRLEEEVEAYQKQCRQVREKSLGSLKTHLPELFRAMTEFSFSCSAMYKRLLSITQSQKQPESLS